jgi:hypothetical protein
MARPISRSERQEPLWAHGALEMKLLEADIKLYSEYFDYLLQLGYKMKPRRVPNELLYMSGKMKIFITYNSYSHEIECSMKKKYGQHEISLDSIIKFKGHLYIQGLVQCRSRSSDDIKKECR